MIAYKQTDPKWKNIKLGTCPTDTIGSSGCFITCLGMFMGITPDIVNQRLTNEGGYTGGCLLNTPAACKIFGLEYNGKVTANPVFPCIGETNYYSKIVNGKETGVPQHFFVMLDAATILDPIDGKQKSNVYKDKMVSYRLFKAKQTAMPNPIDEVIAHKTNEFKRAGEDTVYQIFAIPSQEFFEQVLKNDWNNVRTIPSDWPIDPSAWASQREWLRGEVDAANTKANQMYDRMIGEKARADQAEAELFTANARIAELEDQLNQPAPPTPPVNPPVDPPTPPVSSGDLVSLLQKLINFILGK